MSGIRILYWNIAENRANIDKALYYTEKYDILAVQKVVINRETGRAYYPALSKYTVVYSSGRIVIYVYKRWDIKILKAAEGDNWARITIGEGAAAVTVWSIYSPIQIGGLWNTSLNIIEPENALILVGDFNIHYLLWDIHGRTSRGSSETAAYMLR
jgi:exonuclease III